MNQFVIKHKRRMLLSLILLFILLFIVSINYYNAQVIDANNASLQLLANEKAAHVNLFLDSKKEELSILSSMNVFKEAVLYSNDSSKLDIAKARINELKSIVPGISILTNEGIVVAGDIDLPGTDYSQHPYFVDKRQDTTFTRYYDPLRKGDYCAVIGPVYDSSETNKIIGRIAFDVDLNKLSEIMAETHVKGTEEAYLIDDTGLLLSASRFVGQDNKKGILIQTVTSEGAKKCLECFEEYGQSGSVKEHATEVFRYLNYMGDEVYGAHAYVPAIMGCVIAERAA